MGAQLTKYLDSAYALESISIGPGWGLYIHFQRWGSGEQKYLNISNKFTWFFPKDLPNILVPQGAYKFVAAMDELIRQLPVQELKHPEGDKSPLILFTQTVEGDGHYKFELSAWYQKGCGCYLEIRSVPTSEEQFVYCPFSALSELRKRMVKILAEHDGSQRIGEMPKIPVWTTRVALNIEQQQTVKNADDEVSYSFHPILISCVPVPPNGQNVGDPRSSK